MDIKINPKSFFIFDFDDTLFSEVDFLKSAYRHIASKLPVSTNGSIYEEMLRRYEKKENVFKWLADQYLEIMPPVTVEWLLKEYREHLPVIKLSVETGLFLKKLADLSIPAGLITDGRSITQRNKLKALGLENYFADIIISEEFGSEKPDERNYLYFSSKYPGREFYFFGDNTKKDFIVPARLGWSTVCLKDAGTNIHKQDLNTQPVPDFIIGSFKEVELT